jgi:hypothetical protein
VCSCKCSSGATPCLTCPDTRCRPGGRTGVCSAGSGPAHRAAPPSRPDNAHRPPAVAPMRGRGATQKRRYPARGALCGRRRYGAVSHSPSRWRFLSPTQGDQPSVGIAEDSLQAAAGTASGEGEQGGECPRLFHGSSRTTTARSLPQISDKIRGRTHEATSQAGYEVGITPRSLTHFNLRTACNCNDLVTTL